MSQSNQSQGLAKEHGAFDMNWESIYYWRSWLDHEHNEEYTDRDKGQSLYPNGCSKYTSDHKNLDIYKNDWQNNPCIIVDKSGKESTVYIH